MRVLLIANPSASAGAAAHRIGAVIEAFRRRAEVEVVVATANTAATVAARIRAAHWDRVVALGGDGTFARVADGVLDAGAKVPVALLPAGLANNHARGLGLPTLYDAQQAVVDHCFDSGRMHMDVGLLQGDRAVRFYDTVGFGFQAGVLGRRDRLRQIPGLGGELGYVVATALRVPKRHGFQATARVDGRTLAGTRAIDVLVSNSRWYAGRWVLDRRAQPDDGVLELVRMRGWRQLLRHAWSDRDPGGAADARGAHIELDFDRPVPSQVDGEVGPTGRAFQITVEPGALEIVRPETQS